MNIFLFFFFLAKSQNIKNSFLVEINEFGWIVWDVAGNNFHFYKNKIHKDCDLNGNCVPYSPKNIPILYRLTVNYRFIIKDNDNFFKSHISTNEGYVWRLSDHLKSFDLLNASDDFLYLNLIKNEKEELCIFRNEGISLNFPPQINQLPHETTRWRGYNNGIYSFSQNDTQTFLTKKSPDGNELHWNITLSPCIGSSDLLVSSSKSHAYAFCFPSNNSD